MLKIIHCCVNKCKTGHFNTDLYCFNVYSQLTNFEAYRAGAYILYSRIQDASLQNNADCLMRTYNSSTLSERYIVQGIAILANEHLEAEKQGNNTKRLLSNKIGAARFVLLPCEICVKKLLLTETIYLSRPTILHYEAPAADLTA